MSRRLALFATKKPAAIIHNAVLKSAPHCPVVTQVCGKKVKPKMTPRLAGLKRCCPAKRRENLEAIARTATAGCTQNVALRNSKHKPKQVIAALKKPCFCNFKVCKKKAWVSKPALNVNTICAGFKLKSRNHTPAPNNSAMMSNCHKRGSYCLAVHCMGYFYNPAFKLASINWSKSPSNTAWVLPVSTPVRKSLMRDWSNT